MRQYSNKHKIDTQASTHTSNLSILLDCLIFNDTCAEL